MNRRGIGGSTKRTYLRDLIRKEEVGMVCLQETKFSVISKEHCYYLWGSNEIEWMENGAVNNAGGIITRWRRSSFDMIRYFNGKSYSVIEGIWKVGDDVQLMIMNVYSSRSLKAWKEVWDEISELMKSQQNRVWCVGGDFNSIRRKKERKSAVSVSDYSREIRGSMVLSKMQNCWIFRWLEESSLGTSRLGRLRAELTGFLFLGNGWMYGRIVNN